MIENMVNEYEFDKSKIHGTNTHRWNCLEIRN
jgi:hypothetical protein